MINFAETKEENFFYFYFFFNMSRMTCLQEENIYKVRQVFGMMN